ncbi:SH3 domain-containing protein [Cellulophaga sp. Z1A5H]|uniref:SH3 domain-containing protein n=1 Tax=Cellulophaga sp. Z1A5H TaxID=2687291 RepID=UPI0013FDE3E6|nr:SH3 domain-containing protein [Cellulophaga sp. Z1A5H]
MKKIILMVLALFTVVLMHSQETYFSIASSGLNIREAPNSTANRIGKLPYGSTVDVVENTGLTYQTIEDGTPVLGEWVKIKFYNFPYIVSETKDYDYHEEGYVLNTYLEKLHKATITHKEIDSLTFYSLYKEQVPTDDMPSITSAQEAEKLLASRVRWKNVPDLGRSIDEIILENGQVLRINQESNDYEFVAYYPTEEIILFEGGHTSDYSISIRTGESLETVGNPKYIVASPTKKMRLNGWFPGQECSSYFFQEQLGDSYTYLIDLGWGTETFGQNVCNFNTFYWINEDTFMYSYTAYSDEQTTEKYGTGQITKLK